MNLTVFCCVGPISLWECQADCPGALVPFPRQRIRSSVGVELTRREEASQEAIRTVHVFPSALDCGCGVTDQLPSATLTLKIEP